MTDVAERYAALVAAGELRPDPDQAAAVKLLEELADELAETKSRGSLLWRLAGRLTSLGLLGTGVALGLHRVNTRIEEGAGKLEPANAEPPTSPHVSGGPDSLVPWETLSREGRRHVRPAGHRAGV